MEGCSRCRERWFAMALKDTICHRCYLRDPKDRRPYLMSAENEMDPGSVADTLPELTQVEEMIIACTDVSTVAVSRVKSLDGLLFEGPFNFDHFKRVNTAVSQDRELDYTLRNTQLL